MVQSVASKLKIFLLVESRFSPQEQTQPSEEETKDNEKIYEKESQQWLFQQSWKVFTRVADARREEQHDAVRVASQALSWC